MALAMPLPGQATGGQTTAGRPVTPVKVQMQVYTAELKTTSVQTLADGTTITRESKVLSARDSQGRTLNTTTGVPLPGNRSGWTFTNVNDPVERTRTTWDTRSKKAKVLKLPPADRQQGCWADEAGDLRFSFGTPSTQDSAMSKTGSGTGSSIALATMPSGSIPRPSPQNRATEDLGTATIMGVEVHGYRSNLTTPVGEIGNDRPLVRTNENWIAPGLGLPLRQIDTDPQTGTRSTEVVSLDLSEPDPATFQPPEGYEVVVEELHEVPCQQTTP